MSGIPLTRPGEALTVAGAAYAAATGIALARFSQAPRGSLLLLAGLLAGVPLLTAACLDRHRSRARFLLAAAALGIVAGGGRVVLLPAARHASAAAVGSSFSGVVRQGALPGGRDQVIVDVTTGPGDAPAAVLVRLRSGNGDAPAMAGDTVNVTAAHVGPVPHADRRDDGVELTATGATMQLGAAGGGPGHLLDRVRSGICQIVDDQLPAPVGTIFLGVVFGLRRPLPAALSNAFQATGLVHLLVLSGLKVAVLTRLLRTLGEGLGVSRRARVLTILPAITGYVLVGGAGPAATRSAVMAAAALLLARDGRRVDALPLLAATAIVVLSHDPHAALTVGFQLSYLGTAGIVLLAEPIAAPLRGPRLVREAVAATVAAQLATLPVTAGTFGVVSLIGPAANALTLPLLPLVVAVGGAGVALAALDPGLGWLPLHLAGAACQALGRTAGWLGALPGAAVAVGATGATCLVAVPVVLGGAVARAWVRRDAGVADSGDRPAGALPGRGWGVGRPSPRIAGVALAAMALPWMLLGGPDGRLHLTVLDAGDGVAVLLRTPAGVRVLVDAGASASAVGAALGAALPLDAPGLDGLVLTGAGRRIAGGLAALVPQHPVGQLLLPEVELGSATRSVLLALHDAGTRAATVPPGGAWRWGGADWRCLPVNPSSELPGAVCALQVSARDGAVLVLGDLDPGAQDELAATTGAGLRSRLLVAVPGGALTPALLAAVAPERIVIPGATRGTRLAELAGLRVDRLTGRSRSYVLTSAAVEEA
ncbi:MAG: ComEC/Rec2 family competence protein [Candidatus Dormibacteria bacterium]